MYFSAAKFRVLTRRSALHRAADLPAMGAAASGKLTVAGLIDKSSAGRLDGQ